MAFFTDLEVFNSEYINTFCDKLYDHAPVNSLLVCGGVSKCLSGDSHTPKDLDLLTANEEVYHEIFKNINNWFPDLEIKKTATRIIIYTELIAVEIWNGKTIHGSPIQHYKGVLPFILSSRMKNKN